MAAYKYVSNISPRDRFEQLDLRMDNGTIATITAGHSYELTDNEVARARQFIVLVDATQADSTPQVIAQLPVIGPVLDGEVPVWRVQYAAFVAETPPSGGGGGGGGSGGVATELDLETVETATPVRLVTFDNGFTRSIPVDWQPPDEPTGLVADVHVAHVRVTWNASPTAVSYLVFRTGSDPVVASESSYRDLDVQIGQTYEYSVLAIDQYGLRSGVVGPIAAFIDPALNQTPEGVVVTAWPLVLPSNGKQIFHINALDPDGQQLTISAVPASGALQSTEDPSVFIRSAPGVISVTGTAIDPLGASASGTTAISTGGATGQRTIRRSVFGSRKNWGSFADASIQGPSLSSNDFIQAPAGPLTLGHTFTMLQDASLIGGNIYKHPQANGAITIALWDSVGSVLTQMTVSWVSDVGGWRQALFPSPISVANGSEYTLGYWTPNYYVVSTWVFNGQDTAVYPFLLKSYSEGAGGRFDGMGLVTGASLAFPTVRVPANYYIDPIVTWIDDTPAWAPGYNAQWVNGR